MYFSACRGSVGLPTLYLRHARDHVPLSSKLSTVYFHQCRKNRSLCIQLCKRRLLFFLPTALLFFEDRSKCVYGLKSSLSVEMLQCVFNFYPVRYPLNIGHYGKASRVSMVLCGPDLGWAAFSMNLVGYPLTCRLSWTWDSLRKAKGKIFSKYVQFEHFSRGRF